MPRFHLFISRSRTSHRCPNAAKAHYFVRVLQPALPLSGTQAGRGQQVSCTGTGSAAEVRLPRVVWCALSTRRHSRMRQSKSRVLVIACLAQILSLFWATYAVELPHRNLSAYVQAHTELHTDANVRLRRLLQWSQLFNTTSPDGRAELIKWYQQHDDRIFTQPTNHVHELGDCNTWSSPDVEWQQVHIQQTQEIKQLKELDLILYGDSIFESILGTTVGHKIARANGIPKVWSSHHRTNRSRVLSITGDTTVDLVYRLLNGAMPIDLTVKQAVVQTGANNILKQWRQIPGDHDRITAAIAESIITVCDLILAAWPHTELWVTAILVGGNRGDMPNDHRDWSLPNRYSKAADAINKILYEWVCSRKKHRVSYLDCSQLFIVDSDTVRGKRSVDADLMPDTLHPNRFGMRLLLEQCLEPALYGGTAGVGKVSNRSMTCR